MKRSDNLFIALLTLAFAIRLALVFLLPFGLRVSHRLQGLNDEPSHYNYVKYLSEHRRFPVQTGSVKDGEPLLRNDFEYYQPPLYYLLGAALHGLSGGRGTLALCRLLSLACGILTILVIGRLLRAAGTEAKWANGAMLVAALLPSHAYFCAVASNDALSWLLAALVVYQLYRMGAPARPDFGPGRCAALTLLLALGLLTKSSLAIVYPLAAGVVLYAFLKTRDRRILIRGAAALAVSLAIAAPWYLRNMHLYGSITALNMGFGRPVENLRTLPSIAAFIQMTIHYFWFPMLHAPGGTLPVRLLNYLGALILACHGAAAAWFLVRREHRTYLSVLLLCLLAAALGAYVRLNASFPEPEGRFLFPALAAIAFFFAAPAGALFEKFGRGHLLHWELAAVALYPYLFLLFAKG